MNLEIQWRCKTDHPNCEARDWRPYKTFSEAESERFIREVAPNSQNFIYRIKPDEESDRTMITPDKIFDMIQRQCPFFAVNFSMDARSFGTPAIQRFHSTTIVPKSEGETESICLEITSEKFDLSNAMSTTGASGFVTEMYLRIKQLVEEAVGNKLLERNISTVIGKDKSCLYGEWSAARSDDMIGFTCRVNLTGVVNPKEPQA